jgi:RNA polymerase sigma-70 factor (ECF subfamily)
MFDPATASLIDKALSGDQSAYTSLYQSHSGNVYAQLLYLTRNREDAEDLCQKTFIAAFQALPKFNRDSKLSTWLHQIARRTYLMSIRRLKDKPIESIDDEGFDRGSLRSNDVRLETVAEWGAVSERIDNLPPGQRRIFLMRYEGYEHKEIAKALGCRVGNSKSQYKRARDRIRAEMKGRIYHRIPLARLASARSALCESVDAR